MKDCYVGLRRVAIASAVFGLESIAGAAQITVPVVSGFASGLDGWQCSADEGECSWEASGGEQGGFLRFTDAVTVQTFALAPSPFLGDWTHLDGAGSIQYSHRIIVAGPVGDGFNPYTVRVSGPGGTALWVGDTPSGETGWVRVIAPLLASEWTVQSGTWGGVLEAVTSLQIGIEGVRNAGPPADIAGIDSVRLVPSPGVTVGLMFGVGCYGARRRRGCAFHCSRDGTS